MALNNKANIKIDNLEFTPKAVSPVYESIADETSGRDDSGEMHITWLKNKLVKLEIELPAHYENDSRYNTILNLVQGKVYNLTYWDILEKTEKTIECYTSNSKYSWTHNGIITGVSFSAIQTGA